MLQGHGRGPCIGARVVDLGRPCCIESHRQHTAVRQHRERRTGTDTPPKPVRRGSVGPRPNSRVVDLRRPRALAPHHEHPTIAKKRSSMLVPGMLERTCGRDGVCGGVKQKGFRGPGIALVPIPASRNQDSTIGQSGQGGVVVRHRHGLRLRPRCGRRVVQLVRPPRGACAGRGLATYHQDPPVVEQHGTGECANSVHRGPFGPQAACRVVQPTRGRVAIANSTGRKDPRSNWCLDQFGDRVDPGLDLSPGQHPRVARCSGRGRGNDPARREGKQGQAHGQHEWQDASQRTCRR